MIESGDEVHNISQIEEYASINDGECVVAIAQINDPFEDGFFGFEDELEDEIEYGTCVFASVDDARDRNARKWEYFFLDEKELFPAEDYL